MTKEAKNMQEICRLRPECITCTCDKYLAKCPEDAPEEAKITYMQKVLSLIAGAQKSDAIPVIVRDINQVRMEMFGDADDYTKIKIHFNAVMLGKEEEFRREIAGAKDPLKRAIQLSMVGNYIDFGAMKHVDEEKLSHLLGMAKDQQLDEETYACLREDLSKASRFVFFTDNCGEIVHDKLLIEEIKRQYPQLSVSVVVRGAETLNDATRMDVAQVGLGEVAYVVDNGNDVAGTWMPELSEEAYARMESADVMMAKGQANFETLRCCGKNIYYLFLCKCHIFSDMFGVEPFSGILVRERDVRNR